VTGSTESGDQDFVVFVDEVEATVAGHEGCDTLPVLDELDADALTDGRVGLLGFDSDLLQDDSLGHGGPTHGVGLHGGHGMRLGVSKIMPALITSVDAQFTTGTDSVWLSHGVLYTFLFSLWFGRR